MARQDGDSTGDIKMPFKGWKVNGEEITRLAEGNSVATVGEPRGSISIYAAVFWECSRMKEGLEAPSTLGQWYQV